MTPHKHLSSGFVVSLALAVAFAALAGVFAAASTDDAGSPFNIDIAQMSQDRGAAEADAIGQAAADEESPRELDPLDEERAAAKRDVELNSLIAARRGHRKNIENRAIIMVAEARDAEMEKEHLQLKAESEMKAAEAEAIEAVVASEKAARAEDVRARGKRYDVRRLREKAQFDFGI